MNIENLIPKRKIIDDVTEFLEECSWELEIGGEIVSIPEDVVLEVQKRTYVHADAPDIFLGDHLEAVVIVGCENTNHNWVAKYGYLRMYYDLNGNFVSEDRFSK